MSSTAEIGDLRRRLMALADELEREAGYGGHWDASMHAAARIREEVAGIAEPPVQERQRQAILAALGAAS